MNQVDKPIANMDGPRCHHSNSVYHILPQQALVEFCVLRVLGLLISIHVYRHLKTIRNLKLRPTIMRHLHPVAVSQRNVIVIAKCA